MNTEIKFELLKKIKDELSQKNSVSNIADVNDNKNYHLSFVLYNRLKTDLTLMKKGDMLKIVAIQNYPDLSDKDLYELAQIITKDTKINFTTYQDQLKLQIIYPFANIDDDEDAKNGCLNTINTFVEALSKNEEKLGNEISTINSFDVENNKEKNKDIKTAIKEDNKTEQYANIPESKDTEQTESIEKQKVDTNKSVEDNTQTESTIEQATADVIETKDEKSELSSDFKGDCTSNKKNRKQTNEKDSGIVEQMHEMYAELDRVFQHRKEVADFRENTLNKLKETLELKEKEIKDLIKNKDKIFEEQNKKLEEKRLEIETSQKKLDFNWKTFRDEKSAFEREKTEFENLKELEKSINSI